MAKSLNDATPNEWDRAREKVRTASDVEPVDAWDLSKQEDNDPINHPSHYNNGAIETIDYIVDVLGKHEAMAYCQGNIIKYTGSRLWTKGKPISDAKKAVWYLNKMIELMEETKGDTW